MSISFLFQFRQMLSPSLLQLLEIGEPRAAQEQVDDAVLAGEEVVDERPRLRVSMGEPEAVHVLPPELEELLQRHRLVELQEQDRATVDGSGTGPPAADHEVGEVLRHAL